MTTVLHVPITDLNSFVCLHYTLITPAGKQTGEGKMLKSKKFSGKSSICCTKKDQNTNNLMPTKYTLRKTKDTKSLYK